MDESKAANVGTVARIERDFGPGAPPIRYPDPEVIVLDKSFAKYRIFNAAIHRHFTGLRWAEGPAWNAAGRYLVWSDIPSDVHYRMLEEDGQVSVFHKPSNYANGNTFDWEGRLITCEHGGRRVVRYEHNGSLTVLADRFIGKPLNAPNDVIVHPDGGIWFSDPGYGSISNYEGYDGELELKEAVYRIDPRAGALDMVTDEEFKANGLCFSPDYKKLYVADSGVTHYPECKPCLRVYDVIDNMKLTNGRDFASMTMSLNGADVTGVADGFRADIDGNLWVGAGWVGPGYDGVHIFSREGQRIGQILLPEICANVCFGGPRRNRLYMAASQSIYSLFVETHGAHNC